MLLQLIVTFCFCLAFGTGVEVSTSCPSSIPTSETACPLTGKAWMTCSYNRKTCCPGTSTSSTIYESVAECRNGQWTVKQARCAACPSTCPPSAPASGSACTGNLECKYGKNMTCCNGAVQFSGEIAQCSSGKWRIGVADGCLFGCTTTKCPDSVPAFDSPCTGDVECKYGKNMTCCNGAVQFSGKIAQCSSGKWRIGVADGCLFGCAGLAETSAKVKADCPASVPGVGDKCPLTGNAWMTCSYNSKVCCPGTAAARTIYQQTADCRNGTWTVGVASCSCPATLPATTCPSSADALPSTCTGNVQCKYGQNATCCNGAVQFNGRIYECSNGQWQMGIADGCLFGCTGCPLGTTPTNGASCTTDASLSCTYGSATTARCVQGKWAVATTAPTTCPSSADALPSTCTGNVQCKYGQNATCCNGAVQFNGRIYECSNGQWQMGIADGCMFGCTGCPLGTTPTNGASCTTDASLSCTYGSATTARCVQGKWAVATTAPTTCPSSADALPSTCTGNVQCKYGQNATCCNGAVQFNGRIYECSNGQWQMGIADGCLFGCTGCPVGTPSNGASCTTDASQSCTYGSTTARCVKGKWAVSGGFTDFCPATAPTNGQSCSLGSSAWIHCQYNSKTCSCGGVIYQTDAWCRSPKSVWEVSAVSCPPCLVQEN